MQSGKMVPIVYFTIATMLHGGIIISIDSGD